MGSSLLGVAAGGGAAAKAKAPSDAPGFAPYSAGHAPALAPEAEGPAFQQARDAYFADRVYSGTQPLSVEQVAKLHGKAAAQAAALQHKGKKSGSPSPSATITAPTAPSTASGPAWTTIGPIVTKQVARTSGTVENVAGRVSALAVDHSGNIYLGAAGGGVWRYDATAKTWTALTDTLPTLAVGAITIDPRDDQTIYLGTGEADLSGDSHFGDGIWKSTNAGKDWTHIGQQSDGSFAFDTSTISRLIVQPLPANKTALYVATIRGRGGERRVSPPTNQTWGVFRSDDLGGTWRLLKGTTNPSHGATDLEVDPTNPDTLYASFWGDGMYASNNAKQTQWHPIMNGLPGNAQWAASGTRFAIATAKVSGAPTRLYAGFDYTDNKGVHHLSQLWRSNDAGASWSALPTTGENGPIDSVADYCATQCTYDNVVEVDPSNPDIVYAGGQYNYGLSSGGVYRSVNGGRIWQSLGFDLHPDFHAIAFEPGTPAHIVIGNDGGIWQSPDRGGRGFVGDVMSHVDWANLNAGLTITQFDSIDYADPTYPNRFWGGTQDNGTQRKSSASTTWADLGGGDGGQVLVDHNDTTNHMVFSEYYGISPYRFTPDSNFFGDLSGISTGINTNDRSEFYAPWVMNQGNGNQIFYGTYRVYRSDNAETENPGDVRWTPISGDLTSGCTGAAPNGGRNCTITALGHSEGANALWVGTQEGYVWVAPDAGTSATPHWTRVDTNGPGGQLANRPITSFAVDRSNWRIAYVSYAGYNAATPGHAGHVFKTTDGGHSWTDLTGDLPEGPVNSLILDPANDNQLIAGTDFGAFVADVSSGTPSWSAVGGGLPAVQVWQLSYDSSRALLLAGTHGRGAWKLSLPTSAPAFVASIADSGAPVGPGSNINYAVTVKNEGNADATGVTINAPVPANTSFAAADGGGLNGDHVTWSGVSIPAGGATTVHYSVTIDPALPSSVKEIVADGLTASGSGASTSGSPHSTPIAPAHSAALSTPSPKDGTKPGTSVTYPVTITNPAFNNDSYTMAASSTAGWPTTVLQPDCTTALGGPVAVASGHTATVCVKVDVPGTGVSESSPDTETVTATSTGDPSVSGLLTLTSIPVTTTALIVDEDGNAPDVQSYYATALTSAGVSHAVWDLAASKALGQQYLNAHRDAYWFTGASYPGPLLPYESRLKGYLDQGGHLFVSGQDMLDQAAGQTPFVHDYLHIDWNGSEAQNDKRTNTVTGVTGSVIGNGLGATPLNQFSTLCVCEDQITPIAPAAAQFADDGVAAGGVPQPDALAVTDTSASTATTYRVVVLAFPFEEYGSAANQATLAGRVNTFFGG